ncbi:hypothetical protein AA0119_g10163 [Alternaria tenuissima]|uniref:Uncharacterized protein n=1 Tax=Alternaria tenuissima TaxID=119927 RepID=A0AB37W2Q1_9PLEO|nr:hypothetical protein AA0115_g10898 [Alternaria tenuissima]RYN92193.1 hypothetical protein AA0119_g10163 [Alternaria tenuissima]RYO08335.1 hypothetical protein AA0121_g11435 [Alternaria tenuissima]
MGNTIGWLRRDLSKGLHFTVLEACKAEGVDLTQSCDLKFGSDRGLISIGNITRGSVVPQPGIAGIGIWIATAFFLAVVVLALIWEGFEICSLKSVADWDAFAMFRDKRGPNPGWKDKVRAAGRTFIIGTADAQIIFVGAFLLGFAGQNKCRLTSYHFTVAVNQMMIALSSITFSVALVRTYWRSPYAAAFRLLLTIGSFIGVGLTIFRQANYAPDESVVKFHMDSAMDSAILLPVACLLETELRDAAEKQAKDSKAELGFGKATTWPPERIFYIFLVVSCLAAHISIPLRFYFGKSRDNTPVKWTYRRMILAAVYWLWVLLPPILTSVVAWGRVNQLREWAADSGWMADPNTEMMILDSGQLIAMGVLFTIIMNVLTEAKEREKKSVEKDANDELEEEERLVESRPPSPDHGPPLVESLHATEGYEMLTVRSYGTPLMNVAQNFPTTTRPY